MQGSDQASQLQYKCISIFLNKTSFQKIITFPLLLDFLDTIKKLSRLTESGFSLTNPQKGR